MCGEPASPASSQSGPAPRATLPRSRRLAHDLEYQRVYGAKMRKSAGPLIVFSCPNGRAFHRIGLSVGKRVGGAVTRSRVKRMLREAFRLEQHALPLLDGVQGLDLVLSAQQHEALALESYRRTVRELCGASTQAWRKRLARPSA